MRSWCLAVGLFVLPCCSQGAAGSSQLWYAPRDKAGAAKILGGWSHTPYRPYYQDDVGCAVVYNSDAPGTGGTYLAPIPR